MHVYTFNKDDFGWFIDLPEYIAQGGTKGDLAMVEGADTMLDIISFNGSTVKITFNDAPFDGADKLTMVEKCGPLKGGAIYLMEEWEGKQYHTKMWLCEVTEFVFGHLPEAIFIKRARP